MFKQGKAAVLAALMIPGAAFAQINVGDELGTSEAAILSVLESLGYSATDIEFEDDEIEVEALFAGQVYEIEISPETGFVLAVEDESEDDDDEYVGNDND